MSIPETVIDMIANDNLQKLQEWVEIKNGFGAIEDNGETLLHKAALYGAPKVAAWLLAGGISPNVQDSQGYTPLHEAARRGKAAAIPLLLEYGADPEIKNNNNNTPLEIAVDEATAVLRKACRISRWIKTGDAEVTEVSYREEINYKVTQIFNFAARSYILVMHNEQTKAESVTMKTFGDMAERQLVQTAEKAFTDLGGRLPDDYGYMALEKPGARGLKKSAFGTGPAR